MLKSNTCAHQYEDDVLRRDEDANGIAFVLPFGIDRFGRNCSVMLSLRQLVTGVNELCPTDLFESVDGRRAAGAALVLEVSPEHFFFQRVFLLQFRYGTGILEELFAALIGVFVDVHESNSHPFEVAC